MAYNERRNRPYTVALYSDDDHYLGRISSDSVKQRNAERDELKQQLDEPDRGGLTVDEEGQCREAFARLQTLPRGYEDVWKDKQNRLEAHIVMHTARARAFQARDPTLLKGNYEREQSESSDLPINAANSPDESPSSGAPIVIPQAHTAKTVAFPEAHPKPGKEGESTAGAKKDRPKVVAPSSGSGALLPRRLPSMTGTKGSRTIIDLTNVDYESEEVDVDPISDTAFKKQVGSQTKSKPTPTSTAFSFGLRPQRLETPPTKRQNADGSNDGEIKRNKQGISRPAAATERIPRPSQGCTPPLPSTRTLHKPAERAPSRLFEPVLGAGTSVTRKSEEPEDRDVTYRRFLEMD